MKQLRKDLMFAVVMGMVIPGMLLNFAVSVWNRAVESVQEPEEDPVGVSVQPVLIRDSQGNVSQEQMEDYLVGVVLAEMPAWFEQEALKAQAVVARTYGAKAYSTGGKHGDGSVCTSPGCCQGWISEAAYLQQGGSPDQVEKIRNAVYATTGQVLSYNGELIEATYFSCSGGSTEDAAAVWGTAFPYLQAVDSPGEEDAAYYEDEKIFAPEQVEEALGIRLSGNPSGWVSAVSFTQGGGVDTIAIGGTYFTGTEIREKLGLRSTAFSVYATDDAIAVTTRGYGHRVGMSQYGADAMAALGHTYDEILSHYYRGTELTQLP